jgi:hypothetical protein
MKNRPALLSPIAFAIIIAALCIFSCQESISPRIPPASTQTGNITGKVMTTGNVPVSGVAVKMGTLVTHTNSLGEYLLTGVPVGARILVGFSGDAYAPTQKIAQVVRNRTSIVDAALLPAVRQNLSAAAGGVVQFSGAKVTFPANAVVDSKGNPFNGTAQVKAAYFDPTSALFDGCFPGECTGIRSDNTIVDIESFGFIIVELLNGSEKLQLAAGRTAGISLPIPAAMLASAPSTIPLWYFDETKGSWIEEGAATKTGTAYVGSVKHFTPWNCDKPVYIPPTFIQGHVYDKWGSPINNARILAGGPDVSSKFPWAYTDSSGFFKRKVMPLRSWILCASHRDVLSPDRNVTAPDSGILDIGVFVLSWQDIDSLPHYPVLGKLIDNGDRLVTDFYVGLKRSGVFTAYTFSNSDGSFNFSLAEGVPYTLEFGYAYDSMHTPETRAVTMPLNGPQLDLGTIKLNLGGSTVIGRAVDGNGNPLANVSVFDTEEPSSVPGTFKEFVTDGTGKFSIWVRPNVTFTVTFWYDGLSRKTIFPTSPGFGQTKDLGDVVIP